MIDKKFFSKYQKQLVWFANTSLGRRFLCISNDVPKNKKIKGIRPNAFTWIDKIENERVYYKTDTRTHAKFSKRINRLFDWLPFNTYQSIQLNGEWLLQPKFGLTTTTVYPDADPESTSVDGYTERAVTNNESWANKRSGSGGGSGDADTLANIIIQNGASSGWWRFRRAYFLFDTSGIDSGDTIDSATLSIYGTGSGSTITGQSVVIDKGVPASNTALVNADYNIANWDSVAQSDTITTSGWSTTGYNAFTLNSTGLGNVDNTGISYFGMRFLSDLNDSEPTYVSAYANCHVAFSCADNTGTSQDPKLVVVHSASSSTTDDAIFFGINF